MLPSNGYRCVMECEDPNDAQYVDYKANEIHPFIDDSTGKLTKFCKWKILKHCLPS